MADSEGSSACPYLRKIPTRQHGYQESSQESHPITHRTGTRSTDTLPFAPCFKISFSPASFVSPYLSHERTLHQ